MLIFICIFYYFLAITGCFFWYYFSKFTGADFINSKSLNRKRVYCIIYNYFVLAYTALIYMLMQDGVIKSMAILISVVCILFLYLALTTSLEFAVSRKKRDKSK